LNKEIGVYVEEI